MKKFKTLWATTLTMLVFSGCAVKHPAEIEGFDTSTLYDDEGIVYIYRPNGFFGAGISYVVSIDNEKLGTKTLGTLSRNTHIKTAVSVDKYKIWARTEARKEIELKVEPKSINCVEAGIGIGFIMERPTFKMVDEETCRRELAKTSPIKN